MNVGEVEVEIGSGRGEGKRPNGRNQAAKSAVKRGVSQYVGLDVGFEAQQGRKIVVAEEDVHVVVEEEGEAKCVGEQEYERDELSPHVADEDNREKDAEIAEREGVEDEREERTEHRSSGEDASLLERLVPLLPRYRRLPAPDRANALRWQRPA